MARGRRKGISAEVQSGIEITEKKIEKKEKKIRKEIKRIMKDCFIFKELPKKILHQIIDSMDRRVIPPETTVVTKGSILNKAFFLFDGNLYSPTT